jgi:hypothetical protein
VGTVSRFRFGLKAQVNGHDEVTIGYASADATEGDARKIAVTALRILADNLEAGVDDSWWTEGWGT